MTRCRLQVTQAAAESGGTRALAHMPGTRPVQPAHFPQPTWNLQANVTDKALLNINSSTSPACSPAVILQPSGSCNALAVSPDGSMLATACQDGVARIYSTAKWQLLCGFQASCTHSMDTHAGLRCAPP